MSKCLNSLKTSTLKAPFAWIVGKSKLAKNNCPNANAYKGAFLSKTAIKVFAVNDNNLHLCIKNKALNLIKQKAKNNKKAAFIAKQFLL